MINIDVKTYDKCLTNLASSVAKYFDLEVSHNTLLEVDNLFNNVTNVVMVVCDGMGSNILRSVLRSDDFLVKNVVTDIYSVYPATTTAATTSLLTGLNPCEHGWLGWDMYYKDLDKCITMFLNTIKDTDIKAESYDVASKYFPKETISSRINNEGKYYSKMLYPFGNDAYQGIDNMFEKVKRELSKEGRKFIYAYYENPDSLLHDYGVDSEEVNNEIKKINDVISKFSEGLKDTLLIVTADHGHKNCSDITLSNEESIFELLDGDIWIEGRMCSFKIKSDSIDLFKSRFNELYSNDFILLSKEEVISKQLFGTEVPNKYFEDSIGDFVAVGIGDKYFRYNDNSHKFVSVHAGITDDEMIVPLIAVLKK